jgi:hypothetical protein
MILDEMPCGGKSLNIDATGCTREPGYVRRVLFST